MVAAHTKVLETVWMQRLVGIVIVVGVCMCVHEVERVATAHQ